MPPDEKLTEKTLRAVVQAQTLTQDAFRDKAKLDDKRHKEVMDELAAIKGFIAAATAPEDPARPRWYMRFGRSRLDLDHEHLTRVRPIFVKVLLWFLSLLGATKALQQIAGGP